MCKCQFLVAVFAALCVACQGQASTLIDFHTDPGVFSASGTFAVDDAEQGFEFELSAPAVVTIETTSWDIGFAPNLTLFYADGTATGVSDGGNYNPQLDVLLGPGTWLLVLTEYPNISLGNYSDGFEFSPSNTPFPGVDNFTGTPGLGFGPDSNPFYSSDDLEHTGDWTLEGTTSTVPDPPSVVLICIVLTVWRLTPGRFHGTEHFN